MRKTRFSSKRSELSHYYVSQGFRDDFSEMLVAASKYLVFEETTANKALVESGVDEMPPDEPEMLRRNLRASLNRFCDVDRTALDCLTEGYPPTPGWQPIETAPKVPFSRCLLLDDKGYVTIGEWVDWDSIDQLISPKSKSRWENMEGFPINAVMWMPLPAPPEVKP